MATTHQIDLTKEHCPMTFVKTKLALSKLQAGDSLRVLVTEGEPVENIPPSATEQGYTVVAVTPTEQDGIFRIEIRK